MRTSFAAVVVIVSSTTLVACNGGSADAGPAGPPLGIVGALQPGHLTGSATKAGVEYWADGLLTVNGDLRLHLFRGDDTGIDESLQFIGAFGPPGTGITGQGAIIGQLCSAPEPSRFCGTATPASLVLNGVGIAPASTASGEIRVTTVAGTETWSLSLAYWGGLARFYQAFELEEISGIYREKLAEFAPTADVVVNFDSAGRWFFQDSTTGCTGNGSISPASNSTSVFDVQLTIAGCRSAYARLNAQFDGLATYESSVPWDNSQYGTKMWLSNWPGTSPPAALSIFAEEL